MATSLVLPIFPPSPLQSIAKRFPVRTGSKPVCFTVTRVQTSGGDGEETVSCEGLRGLEANVKMGPFN
ncbi:hypothetical protein DY000_02035333 [Brassica cretica]|uniref:Uncharacterized protein n=1 Tax=Brassica cretica TaxID=69181 RepID=A0ABQ7E0I8_BRACR|nr:hypothetical protein DY000_02035333 [Brassica cretica]